MTDSQPDDRDISSARSGKILSITIILLLFIIAFFLHLIENNSALSGLLIMIGVLSYIVSLFLLEYKSKFTWIITSILLSFLIIIMLIWIFFSISKNSLNLGWLCLCASIFTTLFSLNIIMLRLFRINKHNENSPQSPSNFWKQPYWFFIHLIKDVPELIKDNRPCYLFIAITLFLTTIYFTVFAFAFHDIHEREKGGYDIFRTLIDKPLSIKISDTGQTSNKISELFSGNKKVYASLQNSNYESSISPKSSEPKSNLYPPKALTLLNPHSLKATIRFIQGRANIIYYDDILKEILERIINGYPSPQMDIPGELNEYFDSHGIPSNIINDLILTVGPSNILTKIAEQRELNSNRPRNEREAEKQIIERVEVSYINSYSLALIIAELYKNTEYHNIITLTGFTSSEIITARNMYLSNYELSEARALRVREEILHLLMKNDFPSEEHSPSLEWIIIPKAFDCPDCIGNNNNTRIKECYKTEISIKKTVSNPMKQLSTLCESHIKIDHHHQEIKQMLDRLLKSIWIFEDPELIDKINEINKNIISISETTKNILEKYSDLKKTITKINSLIADITNNIEQLNYTFEKIDLENLNDKITNMEKILNPPQADDPQLLDYFHYTIYTITTTGYGDMIPKSDFAKFLTSLTNIFEIVFGLIFFNVILSRETQDALYRAVK